MLAILTLAAAAFAAVSPGVEQLFQPAALPLIQGRRVAVLAHDASRDAAGTHLVDLLARRTDLKLVEIFAPEHGFRGQSDTLVPDSKDPVTGLPVYSLYGPRKAPTPELLAGIDALVVDLQDVGLRFYTFPATMAFTMRACARAHVRVIVLDRPNPLGGAVVEGAVLEPALTNPNNPTMMYPLATRHGMTIGELARLFNEEIHADLSVVPMSGWKREMVWEDTGLPWIAPSPALMTPEQAYLYGVFGTLESLKLAVGRGRTNEEAFRIFGAPWITAEQSRRLAAVPLPGFSLEPVEWIPTRREFEGQLSRGVRVRPIGRTGGFRDLVTLMEAMHAILGAPLVLSGSTGEVGARWLVDAIAAGTPFEEIERRTHDEVFTAARARVLLY